MPALAFETGYWLRHGRLFLGAPLKEVASQIHIYFLEYVLGAVVLAPVLALLTGLLIWVLSGFWLRFRAQLADN